jgi:hypothetical protein
VSIGLDNFGVFSAHSMVRESVAKDRSMIPDEEKNINLIVYLFAIRYEQYIV